MSRHITELNIETYRGIEGLSVKDLGDVNIFVGDNNCGKTSVLEAVQIICDPSEYNIIQVARQRERYKSAEKMGLTLLDIMMYIFSVARLKNQDNIYKFALAAVAKGKKVSVEVKGEIVEQLIDIKNVAISSQIAKDTKIFDLVNDQMIVKTFIGEINSSFMENKPVKVEINKYSKIMKANKGTSFIKTQNIQTIDHVIGDAFNNIIKNKDIKEKAITLLKNFDNSISDLRYINDDDRFIPVIENNLPDYLPLSMYGDGMKKALTVLNAMVSAENGIVLIDEFETALHTSVMEKVFKFILAVAKQLNIQLFLTTHSIEAVDKMLECADDEIDNIRVVTLKKDSDSGKTLSRSLKGSEVLEDRKSFNFEVRE